MAMPNVHLLGRRSYQSLPSYCKIFDVAIMPFLVNELTLAANPLKVREYLAAGLPVVATPLPEVVKLSSLVHLARTPQEFLDRTEALLRAGKRGPDLSVSRLMDTESWDVKVEEFSWIVSHLSQPRRKRRRQAA
jgi:glycosyltransferase involved in cell wall biosynthesis